MVKKGPWTVAEDEVLMEYVKTNGEGNWNMVEKNSGLMRCGKSCRLRWFNHLRPNLKRGSFTPQEERIVVELHAQIGNRWARIAMKLPGRTDNEIKNFWNTRAKRLERSGLPIYPNGVIPRHNHPIRSRNQNNINTLSIPNHNFLTPNERIVSPFVSSSSQPNSDFKLSPQFSMGPFRYSKPRDTNPFYHNSSFHQFNSYPQIGNYRSIGVASNSYFSPFSSSPSSSTTYIPSLQSVYYPTYPFELQSDNYLKCNPSPLLTMPNSFEPQPLISNTGGELSLIQSTTLRTPFTSSSSYNEATMTNSFSPQYCVTPPRGNSGLLEDIFTVPNTIVSSEIFSDEGKAICMTDNSPGSSSLRTTSGLELGDAFEEMALYDDDLPSLLENFPLDVPDPDWYQTIGGNFSNENDKI